MDCVCIGHTCARYVDGVIERQQPCASTEGCTLIPVEPFSVCGFLPEAYPDEDYIYILYGFRGRVEYPVLYIGDTRRPEAVFPRCSNILSDRSILLLVYNKNSSSIIPALSLEAKVKVNPSEAALSLAKLYARAAAGVKAVNLAGIITDRNTIYEDRLIKMERRVLVTPPTYTLHVRTVGR